MDLKYVSDLVSKESSDFVHKVSTESIQMVITHNNADFKSTSDRLKETIRMIKFRTDFENCSEEQKIIINYYIKIVKLLVK